MRPRDSYWLGAIILAWSLWDSAPGPPKTHGQVPIRGVGKGFKASETDAQGRSIKISGQTSRSLSADQMAFTGMVIEISRGTNASMIIEAADGIFEPKNQVAFSTNEITLRASDERFSISGTGFRYQWSDSQLSISNRVHTVIRKPSSAASAGSPQSPAVANVAAKTPSLPGGEQTNNPPARSQTIDVRSDRFVFVSDLATFIGHVRARDEPGNLQCEILKALFESGGNNVQRIEAEQNVVFEQGDAKTTASQAVFLSAEDVVTLTGKPVWKFGDREGSSDVLIVNNKSKEFVATGDVNVKLPPRGVLPLDWSSPTNTLSQSNRWVQIRSDKLNYMPTGALFQGNVRILDPQGAELTCGRLTNSFSAPEGKLTGIVVEHNVEFKQGETMARAAKGTYQTNSEFITLMGNPTWKTRQGEGQGEVVFINPKTKQIHAERNVSMKLLGSGLESLDLSMQKSATNALVRTNQEFIIVSEEVYYRTGSAIFLRQVRVTSPQEPQHELTCEVLAAFFVGPENKLDELVAQENVQIRQGDLRATADKVVYLVPKAMLELTGHPQINTPGKKYIADHFVLNRTDNTFRVMGNYRIELQRSALAAATP